MLRSLIVRFAGVFTLGWLLGMVVIAAADATETEPSRPGVSQRRSSVAYEPAVHPIVVVGFQLLAATTAWAISRRPQA